jgi:hypothetical protein
MRNKKPLDRYRTPDHGPSEHLTGQLRITNRAFVGNKRSPCCQGLAEAQENLGAAKAACGLTNRITGMIYNEGVRVV